MSNRADIRANTKLAEKRESSEKITMERRVEIYAKIPRIGEIDREIMSSGYDMFIKACEGARPEGIVNDFAKHLLKLTEEKEQLLKEFGYDKDYTEVHYHCGMCNDTGRVNGEICACYKEELVSELYKDSNIGELLKKQTFEKFDLSYYSTKKIGENEMSVHDNMAINLKVCKEFVRKFDKHSGNLFLYGAPGLGKTYLSSAIANSIIKKGRTVLYQSAGQIFSMIEQLKFGKTQESSFEFALDRLLDVDLLIIDDLGTEFITTLSVSEFFRIVNSRILNNMSTIISTNLSLQDIKKIYSERMLSRIMGHFTHLKFYGDDIRLKMGS